MVVSQFLRNQVDNMIDLKHVISRRWKRQQKKVDKKFKFFHEDGALKMDSLNILDPFEILHFWTEHCLRLADLLTASAKPIKL